MYSQCRALLVKTPGSITTKKKVWGYIQWKGLVISSNIWCQSDKTIDQQINLTNNTLDKTGNTTRTTIRTG